jgi:hypothetical protein
MEKSAGAMMGGTGSTRSSPRLSLIEMVDPHPPKVILTRWVKPRITLPIAFDTYRLRSRVGLADAIPPRSLPRYGPYKTSWRHS